MRPTHLEQAVFDRWGRQCVLCGRTPEEWLETDYGARNQDKLSFHHVNGDDTDHRVENVIPLCQSCHVHIHKVDEPPYRIWHRQLPIEHRHAWNEYHHEYYEGPPLTREEAVNQFGDDGGVPVSVKYLVHERKDFDPAEFEAPDVDLLPEDHADDECDEADSGDVDDDDGDGDEDDNSAS
ncbi:MULTISPECIES: HNH endonuclease [unclassified Halorubrum]|jgi:hypothetical protein|uniref:HNH endonuclease n=1 Tax=unclassified Halorubrum TaxID=2642239 RepID=UPI0018EE65D5|nr:MULTISPECIES: hypothetical protein [unclassified Halorubrum]